MAITSPQTFGSDYILEKLVAHFNSLSPTARTIKSNDLPLYNVKVIADGDGQPAIIVGDQSATFPSSKYVGEATYTWVGPRNVPATATNASFFEISKFVNSGPTGGAALNVISKEATFIGTLPLPNITPTLPQEGNYKYTFRIEAAYDGWFGDTLEITINGDTYVFSMAAQGEYIAEFGAFDGDTILVEFVGGSNNGAYFQMRQYEAGDAPNGPTSVDVYQSEATTPTELTGAELVSFTVPFAPLAFDLLLAAPAINLLEGMNDGYGASVTSDSIHSNFIVRDLQSSGTSWMYKNIGAGPGAEPLFVSAGEISGGYSPHIALSPDGLYATPPSGSFEATVYKYDGADWNFDNPPFTAGSIGQQFVVNNPDGTPTLFVAHPNNNRILVYERVADVWSQVRIVSAPINSNGFARPLAVSPDGLMVAAADGSGNCYAFRLTNNASWATGDVDVVHFTNLLTRQSTPAYTTQLSINAAYDLAIGYEWEDYNAEYHYHLEVYGDVYTNGEMSSVIASASHMTEPFTNLTHCDYASADYTNPGFMATTRVNGGDTPVILWLCPEMDINTNWPGYSGVAGKVMMLRAGPAINTSSRYTSCLVPSRVSDLNVRVIVGVYDNRAVEYWEYEQ